MTRPPSRTNIRPAHCHPTYIRADQPPKRAPDQPPPARSGTLKSTHQHQKRAPTQSPLAPQVLPVTTAVPPQRPTQTKAEIETAKRRQEKAERERGRRVRRIYLRVIHGSDRPRKTPQAPSPVPPAPHKSTTERAAPYHARRQRTQTEAAAAAIIALISAAATADANRRTTDTATHKATVARAVKRDQARERRRHRLMEAVLQHHRIFPRPRLLPATALHNTRPNSRVSFCRPIVTHTLVYTATKRVATIGPSLCADSGCSTTLVTETLASEATLPNLGPSKMRVQTANGGILHAKETTKVPFGLGAHNKSTVLKDGTLVDLLCGTKPIADAGLISIFHPGNEGFTSYQQDDVNITYLAPPVIEGYRETEPGGTNLWRIPVAQPRHNLCSGYSFAAKALATNNLNHAMQAMASEGAPELALNVYELPSIEQAVHWMHASLGYPAASTWLKAC